MIQITISYFGKDDDTNEVFHKIKACSGKWKWDDRYIRDDGFMFFINHLSYDDAYIIIKKLRVIRNYDFSEDIDMTVEECECSRCDDSKLHIEKLRDVFERDD